MTWRSASPSTRVSPFARSWSSTAARMRFSTSVFGASVPFIQAGSGARFGGAHAGDEIFCITEAGRRKAHVLLIVQDDALAHVHVELIRHRGIANGETEDLRHRAWQVRHGQLPLPGLADPSLPGKLLDVAGALSVRI